MHYVIGCFVMGAILQRAVLFVDEQVRARHTAFWVGKSWQVRLLQRGANYGMPILSFFEPPLSLWYRCLRRPA